MPNLLPSLKPIPIKDRLSILFVEKGQLDVLDGAFVVVDKTGVRTHVPIGGVACLIFHLIACLPAVRLVLLPHESAVRDQQRYTRLAKPRLFLPRHACRRMRVFCGAQAQHDIYLISPTFDPSSSQASVCDER